jgi:hypothetical protein
MTATAAPNQTIDIGIKDYGFVTLQLRRNAGVTLWRELAVR